MFEAFDAADRDTPPADGEWSPKDIQAHLGAWRRHMSERLAAIREGRPEPEGGGETDATNAVIHAERADWPWDRVAEDAEASATDLVAEIEAADDATLAVDRTVGSIMGNGAEHTIIHAGSVADRVGLGSAVADLSGQIEAIVDRGGWPPRSAAFARYNLACFHALAGRLDEARSAPPRSRCRPRRTCAISRRMTRTWSPSATRCRSSRAADRRRERRFRACDAR